MLRITLLHGLQNRQQLLSLHVRKQIGGQQPIIDMHNPVKIALLHSITQPVQQHGQTFFQKRRFKQQ
ncbi:hypothetical protein D3C85_1708680 [compost metagenome]